MLILTVYKCDVHRSSTNGTNGGLCGATATPKLAVYWLAL